MYKFLLILSILVVLFCQYMIPKKGPYAIDDLYIACVIGFYINEVFGYIGKIIEEWESNGK